MSITPAISALFEARATSKAIATKLGLDLKDVRRLRKEWKGGGVGASRTRTREAAGPLNISQKVASLFDERLSDGDISQRLGVPKTEIKALRTVHEWRSERGKDDESEGQLLEKAQTRLGMTFVDWAEDKSVQAEMVVGHLMYDMQKGQKVNAAGLAAMFTRAREAREKVELIRATMGGAARTMEELREQTLLSIEEWPDELVELAFKVYAERHRGQVLFVSGNGEHRAEYDTEEGGWVRQA